MSYTEKGFVTVMSPIFLCLVGGQECLTQIFENRKEGSSGPYTGPEPLNNEELFYVVFTVVQ